MTTYKLNIFKDSRESWTESALNPFININPLYIYIPNEQKELLKEEIYNIISKYIININDPYSTNGDSDCDLDLRIFDKNFMNDERKVIMKGNKNSVVEILMNNNMIIYQKSTGKYWCRYYIELKEIFNKGSEYCIDEIECYIKQMFEDDYKIYLCEDSI